MGLPESGYPGYRVTKSSFGVPPGLTRGISDSYRILSLVVNQRVAAQLFLLRMFICNYSGNLRIAFTLCNNTVLAHLISCNLIKCALRSDNIVDKDEQTWT